ncbi:hypothetical protein [Pelagovum pacificum]|uniref:Chemotaxis protein n=1 Tax=Pelagovum pacificum TaxID=2588711 RepID=A0A5C5G9L0_9RHOB|nr:hypothetical protein [Pelagovum pacificum]QQA41889.1 hypothetical protein I8N54_13930 [Pelagovum pacificum]TNY30670.1 hypothetical protein FHY64_19010 [Pelagovum pacificum]
MTTAPESESPGPVIGRVADELGEIARDLSILEAAILRDGESGNDDKALQADLQKMDLLVQSVIELRRFLVKLAELYDQGGAHVDLAPALQLVRLAAMKERLRGVGPSSDLEADCAEITLF